MPVSYISVPTIPLTPNGKIDHKALPDPQNQETQNRPKYVAPRDETEAILCKLWGEILKLDRVGIDDDFFAIGGHSLLAAKLFSRLDEHLGRSLPLGVLFAAPTVRALADLYRASVGQKTRALVALRKAGSLPPVFAVPGVFGNVVGFAELCRELGPGQPFYGLQSVGLDGSEPPLSSIEEMAVLYISEIRTVQPRGPYILLGACFGATVAYEMAHQLLAQGEEVAFLGLLDPTPREGNALRKGPSPIPRTFRRAAALGSLALGRLHLYAEELRRISGKDRLKYFMQKFHILSRLGKKTQNGARRELNQIEVYHANLAALDHYRRLPLDGALTAVEIFRTARLGRRKERDPVNWNTFWSGTIVQHRVPGKNSGDMLSGSNVKILATLLAKRLSESLGATSASPVARQANHTRGTERT
ncbi:MAG TPA: thioesterase domain-containing protein [Verrucomicrobiae bacterium]|nr:thioesterase domain-containing protein [Verrucomicrobiae bacterium]